MTYIENENLYYQHYLSDLLSILFVDAKLLIFDALDICVLFFSSLSLLSIIYNDIAQTNFLYMNLVVQYLIQTYVY